MMHLLTDPAAWAALVTLIVMEVVLGIDNLVFVAILSNKLPIEYRSKVRRLGISLALVMRILLLGTLTLLVGMKSTVFDLGIQGAVSENGHPAFETAFSWRDLILLAGGIFLVWKATKEIHHGVDNEPDDSMLDKKTGKVASTVGGAILQIVVLDLIFSVDSILTAVGMTNDLPIMIVAVVVAVGMMLVAADPLGNFIASNPSVVMLALGFLLMIGAVLIADAFGAHVPKGYIYAAMAFSAFIETLNLNAAKRRKKREKQAAAPTE